MYYILKDVHSLTFLHRHQSLGWPSLTARFGLPHEELLCLPCLLSEVKRHWEKAAGMLASVPSFQCCWSLNLGCLPGSDGQASIYSGPCRGLCELRLPGTNPTSSSISITLNHFSVTNLPNGFSTNWQMVETKLSPSLSLPSILRQLYCNVYHDLRTIYGDFFQQVSLHYSWPNRLNYFSFRLLSLLQVVHYFWVVVWFLRQAARGWGGILLFVLLSSKTF